jgi:anaerobic C4-dicarboxylate transporter
VIGAGGAIGDVVAVAEIVIRGRGVEPELARALSKVSAQPAVKALPGSAAISALIVSLSSRYSR